MKKTILLPLLAILFLAQCKEEELPPQDLGYNYFPIEEGHYVIYDADSMVWDDIASPPLTDTFNFQVKLRVEDSYTDGSGRTVHRWVKYTRTDTTSWVVDEVYGIVQENSYLEIIEENLPHVRMSYPIGLGNSWDLNAYNNFAPSLSTYIEVDQTATINNWAYDSTCMILHEEQITLISDDYAYDRFTRQIGLTERYERHLLKEVNGSIKGGYIKHYKIESYGTESLP